MVIEVKEAVGLDFSTLNIEKHRMEDVFIVKAVPMRLRQYTGLQRGKKT